MNEEFKYIDEEEKEIIEMWKNVDFSKLKNDEKNLKELKKLQKSILKKTIKKKSKL
ncbi:hypothetical protein [Hippea alviniae]|uniref:hypothetical protein n=1 Tax=Hippea alviniae TaxID=1279027 RepID=UPI0003B586D3|nr:hypothetical protein [Hippea alviniae]